MEGFLSFRMRPWMRRLVTRLVAIVPALLTILFFGANQMTNLLVASQVVLSLQLPFAVVPLLQFTSERARMGSFANPNWVRVLGWIAAAIIIVLNAYLICWEIGGWIQSAGSKAIWIELTLVPLAIGCGLLLAWLIVQPWLVAHHRQSDGGNGRAYDRSGCGRAYRRATVPPRSVLPWTIVPTTA